MHIKYLIVTCAFASLMHTMHAGDEKQNSNHVCHTQNDDTALETGSRIMPGKKVVYFCDRCHNDDTLQTGSSMLRPTSLHSLEKVYTLKIYKKSKL
jgi:hypothetical protein